MLQYLKVKLSDNIVNMLILLIVNDIDSHFTIDDGIINDYTFGNVPLNDDVTSFTPSANWSIVPL